MSSEPDVDPYGVFARRRPLGDLVAEEVEQRPDGSRRQWFGAYRWESVRAALADEAVSAALYHEVMGLEGRYGDLLLGLDPPEHRAVRAVLQPSFSRPAVARWQPMVVGVIGELLAELAPAGGGDLLTAFCEPMPALVLTRLLAVDADLAPLLREQAAALNAADRQRAIEVSDELQVRLQPVIDRRRRHPGDDLVSVLAAAERNGRPLEDLEVFAHLRLLAIAGTDTVSRATANLVFALLHHPDQYAAVGEDPALVPAAVEEAVRWECPALAVPRLALRPTRIGASELPAGAAVRCGLGAANRDPERWPDPDRYDLFRAERPHAGFGLGIHVCLGVHLAHLIMSETVLGLLTWLPGLRVDPHHPPGRILGDHVRAPEHLAARWSPSPVSTSAPGPVGLGS